MVFPLLPPPPSWYPGHMSKFARMLPALLSRTDVVLELRDARLPLTSINRHLEGTLQRWRRERGQNNGLSSAAAAANDASALSSPAGSKEGKKPVICEHVVVLNKSDLVPEWGVDPFRRAMAAKFPGQRVFFASWNQPRCIKALNELLVSIAKSHPLASEMNVLVVGMPNVGKSTLLNALRNIGIRGPTPKALRTSAHPGLTRALSTRLKLSESPLVYSFDSPGVMLPFLGKGDKGAERGVKLALIAGIKEGLYDVEALAAYLLYRLNVLDPVAPAYLPLLGVGTGPTDDVMAFLDLLAARLGMLKRGGERDVGRAASWFVKWWREEGGLKSASAPDRSRTTTTTGRMGWGFDFEWTVEEGGGGEDSVERKMEGCIDEYLVSTAEEEGEVSWTQMKKTVWREKMAKRMAKQRRKSEVGQ